jgi:hypothetical protein
MTPPPRTSTFTIVQASAAATAQLSLRKPSLPQQGARIKPRASRVARHRDHIVDPSAIDKVSQRAILQQIKGRRGPCVLVALDAPCRTVSRHKPAE